MNHEPVYRTGPATPGLLITFKLLKSKLYYIVLVCPQFPLSKLLSSQGYHTLIMYFELVMFYIFVQSFFLVENYSHLYLHKRMLIKHLRFCVTIFLQLSKLDGVGPVENRTSTDQFHPFRKELLGQQRPCENINFWGSSALVEEKDH